ncbi:MAG: integrase arm-type DNA-binding domain-containing protein [Novosphingobium sp.]|nr:integrase arm-type DNA-binding domain-containing protein [Novosphingobium sp.]
MALTDTAIRAAKPQAKQYKLYDERGLLMLVRPSGGKLWRFKYRVQNKEQLLSLGTYPDVGLKEARAKRDAARRLLDQGKHPGQEKKKAAITAALSAGNTFKLVAEEYIEKQGREGRAEATLTKARWHLELLKRLHHRPISEIEAAELLAELRKIEANGRLESARQVRAFASRVFCYGVATTRCKYDVASPLVRALTTPTVTHHAAILEPEKVGALLRAIDAFDGQITTRLALQLAPHVFVRPGELRHAEWSEIDFDASVWTIPASKTKMRRDHLVPLTRQSIEILHGAHLLTGTGKLVFPGLRTASRPLSENTLNAALRRMGYAKDEMTAHGFRSVASTLLNQSGKWRPDVVERALAHGERDKIRAAYNRAEYWEERVEMSQWWSDYLDTLRDGAKVIPLKNRYG